MLNRELVQDFGLGLTRALNKRLIATGEDNSRVICDYIKCLGVEIRLSENYKKLNAVILLYASEFHSNNKKFKELTKDDIISFLSSLRKSENVDPLHSWVSTYNTYL